MALTVDDRAARAKPGTASTERAFDSVPTWVGSWAAAPQLTEPDNLPPAPGLRGNTLRQVVFATLSGKRTRLCLSNEWGDGPLRVERVRLAVSTGGSQIDASTEVEATFRGASSATVDADKTVFSDPVDFRVTALSRVAITLHFGETPSSVTGHPGSRTTSYIQKGDATTRAAFTDATSTDHWYFITALDVETNGASAVVTLGDSITDGRGSTTNGNDRWPDNLARRLLANPATSNVAVLNMGIGGNAVVRGGLGPPALERFERDVLRQRGARWVVLLEGINDIGGASGGGAAEQLVAAYERLVDMAHHQGLLVYGVPVLPFGGSDYDTALRQEARQKVNRWIRTAGRFDAVIDLDATVCDPAHPTRLRSDFHDGDRLHLSPAGYRAMADAIDLSLFE